MRLCIWIVGDSSTEVNEEEELGNAPEFNVEESWYGKDVLMHRGQHQPSTEQ